MAFEESQNSYTLLAEVFVARSYDRWNLEVQARKCAAAVALRTPKPLRVEEE